MPVSEQTQANFKTVDELMLPSPTTLQEFFDRFMQAFRSECNSELRLLINRQSDGLIVVSTACADRCREREIKASAYRLGEALTQLVDKAELEQKRQQLRALVENLDSEGVERAIKAAQC